MSVKPVAWTPGPWGACRHGECSCGQVWSVTAYHPVATVITGVWGDTYPAIRLTEGPGMSGTTAEAYLERMDYGEVDKDVAAANARLIASAPELAEALQRIQDSIPRSEKYSDGFHETNCEYIMGGITNIQPCTCVWGKLKPLLARITPK